MLTLDEALETGGAAVIWHPISPAASAVAAVVVSAPPPWRPARAPEPGVTCALPPYERRGCRRTGRRPLGLCRLRLGLA